jgi:hypothetical protein
MPALDVSTLSRLFDVCSLASSGTNEATSGALAALLAVAMKTPEWGDPETAPSLEELPAWLGQPVTTLSQHMRQLGEGYGRGKPGLGFVDSRINPDNRRKRMYRLTPSGYCLVSLLLAALSAETI